MLRMKPYGAILNIPPKHLNIAPADNAEQKWNNSQYKQDIDDVPGMESERTKRPAYNKDDSDDIQ